LVNSLLTAIVEADGDALVMHVGEQPYVVAASGPVELSSRPLTIDAVSGMLAQLLPADSRRTLDELGAVEHDLPQSASDDGDRFTVVAARGGDDIWIEIRRHRTRIDESSSGVSGPPAAAEGPVDARPSPPAPVEAAAAVTREPVSVPAAPEPAPSQPAQPSGPTTFETAQPSAPATERSAATRPQEQSQAVVLPLARNPVRTEPPPRPATPTRIAGVDRLLRLAAARGATTLHLMSGSRPSVRVDGEIAALDGEPVLSAGEVESLLLDLAPEPDRDALRSGEGTEWVLDVPDVGRFRCQGFRDHRGPGGTFRLIAARPTSTDQLGLSKEIQALSAESSGLVLVAGPRSSGKSTLISAFIDLVNRTRTDYVITVESQISCTHENRGCLVSQREVRGGSDEIAAAVRTAIRENPDVLVIDDLRSPAVVELALEAVARGHLVIGAISAHTAMAAIGRVLRGFPPEKREQVQVMLAEGLRGAVSQVLVRKAGGGRVAAREVILNTPATTSLIADGRLSQLPLAVDSGRKHGMVPLNDALAAFVQSGVVDVRNAYRQAFDRPGFLAVLRREGIDTSFAERLV
jgi:twitching motility protein PilT